MVKSERIEIFIKKLYYICFNKADRISYLLFDLITKNGCFMKRSILLMFLLGSVFVVFSQMTLSSGSQVILASGSQLVVKNIDNTSGAITNDGDIYIKGDITNNSGDLFDSDSDGTVTLNGSSPQEITGSSTTHFYGTLDVNNFNDVSLTSTTSGSDQQIQGLLTFTNGNLILNGFNLTIGTTDPTGTGSEKYIITNGDGMLKRTIASSDVIFPVGNSGYNPITINNMGTSDLYGVKVVDNEPSGASNSHMVDRSWVVTESTSGNSNLTITSQWNSNEEGADFDNTNCAVMLTTNAGSSYSWEAFGAASGFDPFTRSGSGFTSVGTFAIGDDYADAIIVDIKAFLAGAYNSTTGKMDNTLNTQGLIPTTDPYSGTTTFSSIPANAVDWIKIELRDKNDNTSILYSFVRFIDEDGQVIEEDATDLTLPGVQRDSYYIAMLHRNHCAVISSSTVNLDSSPVLDFTSSQASAWQNGSITTNAAMKEIASGIFALWDGDSNGDGQISYNGVSNDRIAILNKVGATTPDNTVADTYSQEDVNFDGDVNYNGTDNDRNTIINNVGATTPGNTITQHLPE